MTKMGKYIDRAALFNSLANAKTIGEVFAAIQDAPAEDVQEVRRGRWYKGRVSSTGGGSYGVYQCSICEALFPDVGYGYNYCPNCGAKMDEVEE